MSKEKEARKMNFRVLIIGETKKTKYKVWNYYKKILKIEKEAEVFSSDLQDSDFIFDWNKPIKELIQKQDTYIVLSQFDYIIANNVLEHVLNLKTFLENIKLCLPKNGLFVIRTDNALYLPYYLPIKSKILAKLFGIGYHSTNLAKEIWNENHYHIFTKNHLINLLSKFGFKVEKIEYGIWKYKISKLNIPIAPRILIIARKM
jgi:2-polyprenyl-3-methyl-5-hydroxy-6-metoxy-1,4-benzoquinol methylase